MKKYILSLIKHLSIIVSICCISYAFIIIIFVVALLIGSNGGVDILMNSEPIKILSAVLSLGLILLFYVWKNNFFTRNK
tara:strand:+ start:191 stop:427 length:237 start_codon:yes stop_codon:yes gene_type:complete